MAGFGYSGTTSSGGFGGYGGSSGGGFGFGASAPQQSVTTYAPASPEEILARLKIMRAFAQIQATPKQSDHGLLGRVAGTISRIPGDVVDDFVSIGKSVPFLALGIGTNVAKDYWSAIKRNPGAVISSPAVVLNSFVTGSNKGLAPAMVTGTLQDLRHPLRHPGYTALDVFGIASLGAGSAGRAAAAAHVAGLPRTAKALGVVQRLAYDTAVPTNRLVDGGVMRAGYHRVVQPFSFGDKAAAELQRADSLLNEDATMVNLGQGESLIPPSLRTAPETTSEAATATDMWSYLDLKGKRAAAAAGQQTSLFGPRPDTRAAGGQIPPKGTPDTLQYGPVSDFMESFTPSPATERALYKEATGGLQNPNRVLRDPNATPPPAVIGQGVLPETFPPAPYRLLPQDIQHYARQTGIVKPGDVATHPAIAAIDKRIAAYDQAIEVRRQAIANLRAVPRAEQPGWSDFIDAENRSTLTDATKNPTLLPSAKKWEAEIKRFESERRNLVRQRHRLSAHVEVPDVPTGQMATGSPLKIGASFDETIARTVARRQAEERLNYQLVQAQMEGASLEQARQVLKESGIGNKTDLKAAKRDIETAKEQYSKHPHGGAPGTVADRFDLQTADLTSLELRRKAGEGIISNAEKNLAELKASKRPNPRIVRRDELRIERMKQYMAEHQDLPPSVLQAMDAGTKMEHPPVLAQKIKRPTTLGARTNRSSRSGSAVSETPTAKVQPGSPLEKVLAEQESRQKPVQGPTAEAKRSQFMQTHGRPEPAPPGTPRQEYLFEVTDQGGRRDVIVKATNQEWAEYQAKQRYKGHAVLKGVYDERGKVRELQPLQPTTIKIGNKKMPLVPEPVNPREPSAVTFSDEQAKAAFAKAETESKLHAKIADLERKQDALYKQQDAAKTPAEHEKIRQQLDKVSEQRDALWRQIDELNGDLRPEERIIDQPPAEQPPLTSTTTAAATTEPAPAEPFPRGNAPAAEPKPAEAKPKSVSPPKVGKGKRVLISNTEGETSAFAVLDEKTNQIEIVKQDGSDFGRHPKGSPEAQLWAKTQREGLAARKHLAEQEAAKEIRGKIARDEPVNADDFQEFVRDNPEGRAAVEAYLGRDLTFRETPKSARDLGTNQRSINKAFAAVGKETTEARSLEKTITGQLADQISNEGVLTRKQILDTLNRHVPPDVAKQMLKQMEEMVQANRWGPKMGIAFGLPKRSPVLDAFLAPRVPVSMQVRSVKIDPKTGDVVTTPATVELPNNPVTAAALRIAYGLGERYTKITYTQMGAQFIDDSRHARAIRGMMNWRAEHEAAELARITKLMEQANHDTDYISTLRAFGVTTKDLRRDNRANVLNRLSRGRLGQDRATIMPSGKPWVENETGGQGALFQHNVVNSPAPKIKEGVWESQIPAGKNPSVQEAKRIAREREALRRKQTVDNTSTLVRIPMRAIDTANDIAKLGILYLKPAYLSANVLGQILLVTADHGLNPIRLTQSVKIQRELFQDGRIAGSLDRRIREGLLTAEGERLGRAGMGSGPIGAMAQGETGLLKRTRNVNNALNMRYQKLLDTPWRDISLINEARRWGFNDAKSIADMLTNPVHADVRTSIMRRANRNIIDYGRLSSAEKAWITRLIFFYPWIKGSSLWAMRWISEHPAQALAATQMSKTNIATNQRELGMMPSYLEGAFKTGERFQKGVGTINKVFNPTAVSVLGSPAEVLETAKGLWGNPRQSARLSEMLTPAASIMVSAATGIDPFTQAPMDTSGWGGTLGAAFKAQVGGTIAPVNMLRNINLSAQYAQGQGGVENKLVPYNEGEAISKWLGPGFSLFTPEVSKAIRAVGASPVGTALGSAAKAVGVGSDLSSKGGGEVARDITASQPINPAEARSRAAAELRSTQGKLAAKAQLYRDYVMQANDEAKRKNVALPKDFTQNMNLYGQREINRVTWARALGKKENDLTAYERMLSDIDLLMSRGILTKQQGKYLAVQMSGQPDSLIENLYGRWTHYYFGGGRLSQIKKEMELKGVKVTY